MSSFEERRMALIEKHGRAKADSGAVDKNKIGWSWFGFFFGLMMSAFSFHAITDMGDIATWASGVSFLANYSKLVSMLVSGWLIIAFFYMLVVVSRTTIPLGLAGINPRSPLWPRRGSMSIGIVCGILIGIGPERAWHGLLNKLNAVGVG